MFRAVIVTFYNLHGLERQPGTEEQHAMKFSELNLNENLMKGIDEAGFTECLPVQERTYEHTLKGRDVMVQSQTGSGKTAAFLVSIYQLFSKENYDKPKRALIIAPTRELAVQIEDEAKILGAHLPFRTGCFYGGVGYERQERLLQRGVDIIIGTPGRLIDFNQSRRLTFNDIGILIIDEADRLFDMGFLPDIRRMVKKMPDASHRQTMLFSATLTSRVRALAMEYMNDPVEVEVAPEHVTVDTVTQELYHVGRDEKLSLLLGLLRKENPSSALIFTNMKSSAIRVAQRLKHNGFGCEYIIGDLPQQKRLAIINAMKAGKIRFLVATDVAARGLHINDLDLVVNYDLPADPEAYVHRIGRTARAGKKGKAITLVCERYVYGLEAIESLVNTKIPVAWADESEYAEDKSKGLRFHEEKWGHGTDKRAERGGKPRRAERQQRPGTPRRDERPRPAGRPVPADKSRHIERPKSAEKLLAQQRPAAAAAPGETAKRTRKRGKRTPQHERDTLRSLPHAAASRPHGETKQPLKGPDRKQPVENRIDYYRKKYGEDFSAPAAPKKRKRTKIMDAIRGIFSRKKTAKKS
jgi:ATP-dependent RNA helicase RhlB